MPRKAVLPKNIHSYDFIKLSKKERDPRARQRMLALAHLQEGKTINQVAELFKVFRDTVSRWLSNFGEFGLEGLYDNPRTGRKCKLENSILKKLPNEIEELQAKKDGGRVNADDITKFINNTYCVNYSNSGVYKILNRIGMSWVSARSKHPNSSLEKQEDFKKILTKVKEAIPSNIELSKIDIWFQDEARIGQQGTITRIWAKTGTRPRAVRQLQYEYAYIYGAVCPERDQAVALIMPAVNNEAMKKHLEEISKVVPKDRHAVIILDRAAWHTSGKINCFNNITILPLPSASPELNPIEQVWQYLCYKFLANRVFAGYEDILKQCSKAWNNFCNIKNKVKNLCSRNWACISA